jgi:hypothetical protein
MWRSIPPTSASVPPGLLQHVGPTLFCGSGGVRYELVEIGVDGALPERGLHFKSVRLQLLAYCGSMSLQAG